MGTSSGHRANPLDGGALTHPGSARSSERARGGAAPFWPPRVTAVAAVAMRWANRESGTRRASRPSPAAAVLLGAVAQVAPKPPPTAAALSPRGADRESQREEREGAGKNELGFGQQAGRLQFLFTRNRRRAIGSKSTARICLGQIWPRRGRSFPAQAQVAAWARGGACGWPAGQVASARAVLLDGPRQKKEKKITTGWARRELLAGLSRKWTWATSFAWAQNCTEIFLLPFQKHLNIHLPSLKFYLICTKVYIN